MPKLARHCVSALLCIHVAGVALRVVQWRIYGFDIVSDAEWRGLWRGFVANEIVFDTPYQCGFLVAFPLALILAILGISPLSATLHHVAMRIRQRAVLGPEPESMIVPDRSVDRAIEEPKSHDREIADLLYRQLFDVPAAPRQGDNGQDHGQA